MPHRVEKPLLGPVPYLPPTHYCYAPPSVYAENHGVDGLKIIDGSLTPPCPYCVSIRSDN